MDGLLPNIDVNAAVAGLLTNPVFAAGLTILLGSIFAPVVIRVIRRAFGRG